MSVNAEVQKSGNESALSVIRKFSRRVQGTGLIKTVRNGRYHVRDTSKIVKKKRALKMLKKRANYKQLIKEGKIAEQAPRGSRPMTPRTETGPARFGESTPIAR